MENFRLELSHLLNRFSKENGCDTPDFVLAEYLHDCLTAFDKAVNLRSDWMNTKNGKWELVDKVDKFFLSDEKKVHHD
jgi:hypothetical protein